MMKVDRRLTFLLRRIEHDVEREQAILEIVKVLKEKQYAIKDICTVIETDIIYKIKVLNTIGIGCFLNDEYDSVIPFLEVALRYSPTDPDTIYNIGYVLTKIGLNKEAFGFLNQVHCLDEGVLELKQQIKAKIIN